MPNITFTNHAITYTNIMGDKLHMKLLVFYLGGALGYFLGGYMPPGTPNWHPILDKISPKIDTLF